MNTQQFPENTPTVSIERFASIASDLGELVSYLQYSEYELILYMESQGVWQGQIPSEPEGFTEGAGNIDAGIYLYWLNTPSVIQAFNNNDLYMALIAFTILIGLYKINLPPSLLTADNYQELTSTGLIYSDGSVLSVAAFALYDPNWLYALVNLGKTVLHNSVFNNGVLPSSSTLKPMKLSGATPDSVCLGLLSDWGAGSPAATSVMNGLTALNPDCLIHLGDIYYSGSPTEGTSSDFNYSHPDEVSTHFLSKWPANVYSGQSFTMNGNHEMYCGGNGYFGDALASPIFKSQQNLSYGALQIGDWTILYLDSAFYSNITQMYMYGSIGGALGVQGAWITSLKLDPQKVIVMTHHNGFDPTLSAAPQTTYYQPFWNEIHDALGGDPYAWYWGHMHNAIVYKSPVTIKTEQSTFITDTLCRCIGNGSMPYGNSTALGSPSSEPNPFDWCAQYAYTDSGDLPNGFTTLTFALNGTQTQVTQITENYYLINSPSEPAYTNPLFT